MNEVLHSVESGDMAMYVTYDLFNERFNVCVKRHGHGDDWVYFYKSYKTINNAIAAGMKRMPKN
jgi:hypothetical protein